MGLPPATLLPMPALALGTKVVTVWVTLPVPRLWEASPRGVPVAVKLLVTLVPLVKVALGKTTLTCTSQLPPGPSGTLHGLVQVTVAGVVPSHPGSQSAAGLALVKTVPAGSVSTTGPIAVSSRSPPALPTAMRRR